MKKINLKHLNRESHYAEFDYEGICFYISSFDPQFAYGLNNPEFMIVVERIDFNECVIYVNELIKL
jgi:hypothetical protein